ASPRHGARTSHLARFAVDDLAARITAELSADRDAPLRLNPLVRVEEKAVRVADRAIALPPELLAALRAGPVRASELPAEHTRVVAALVRARVLAVAVAPAATSLDDLGDLRAAVAATGLPAASAWVDRLDAIASAVDAVSVRRWPLRKAMCVDVERTLAAVGRAPSDRPAGTLYADRQPVFEEGVGGLRELRVHRPALARHQRALGAVLHAHAAYATAVRADARAWLADGWSAAGLPARVSLYELLDAVGRLPQPDYHGGSPSADALWRRLDGIAPEGTARVDISADELDAAFADAVPDEPFVCSPDLLLRGPRGQVVVGEVHQGIQPWCWLIRSLPAAERERLRAEVGRWARELAGDAEPITLVEPRFTGKTFTLEYPGLALERVARSALPPRQVRSLHSVLADRDAMRLHDSDGRPLVLMPTSPVSPLCRAFAGPVLYGPRRPPLDRHRPRVVVDDVVWFRESWRLDADDLAALAAARDPAAATFAVARLRDALGLPRHVYLAVAGEPKPVYLDLAAVAYCDLFARLVAGRQDAVVTEMLPAPDELVLDCADGVHTSELRTAMIVRRTS
ncbi:lantibiotic dehydratase, partial [Actinosynnema sp. NPDC059797]